MWEWLVNLPIQFAAVGEWLNTPIFEGWATPLQIVGVGLLGFVASIITFKMIRLIIGG